jgi:hypothetical protein
MTRLERSLRHSTVEAFLLALEIINKPTITYRLEVFCFLLCNAWELLLKAHLLSSKQKIFYKKKPKEPRKSLSLGDCINRIFLSTKDPVRLNIEKIQELRDHATHLVIPVIPLEIMSLFQASVLNYARALKEWTEEDLARRVPMGMMALVFDPGTEGLPLIRTWTTKDSAKWLESFAAELESTAKMVSGDSLQFYLPINLKLALIKNPAKADIVLGVGSGDAFGITIEIPKDPDKTHPLRQIDVLQEINKRCETASVNSFHLQSVRRIHRIESRSEFYYKSKFATPQYSAAYVEWLINEFEKDPQFFAKARAKFTKPKLASE